MSELHRGITKVLDLLNSAQAMDQIQAGLRAVHPHIRRATSEELTEQLRRFVPGFRGAQPSDRMVVAIAALLCGTMVEHGGDSDVCGEVLLDCLEDLLRALGGFWEEVRRLAGVAVNPENANSLADVHAGEIAAADRPAALAYFAHPLFVLGVVAHLSMSKSLRATARTRPALLELAPNVDVAISEDSRLGCLLRVLDDEPLLVLHAGERKGFQTRMTGVADLLQLGGLCAARLIGKPAEGWLPGRKPDRAFIAAVTRGQIREDLTVEGVFNLWPWQALRSDGSLPAGRAAGRHLLPWTAFPDEIPDFEGTRVLLLSPRNPPASWPGTRRYREMAGDLVVEHRLSADETADWLTRIAAASKAG
jgi:hypothetical protein